MKALVYLYGKGWETLEARLPMKRWFLADIEKVETRPPDERITCLHQESGITFYVENRFDWAGHYIILEKN